MAVELLSLGSESHITEQLFPPQEIEPVQQGVAVRWVKGGCSIARPGHDFPTVNATWATNKPCKPFTSGHLFAQHTPGAQTLSLNYCGTERFPELEVMGHISRPSGGGRASRRAEPSRVGDDLHPNTAFNFELWSCSNKQNRSSSHGAPLILNSGAKTIEMEAEGCWFFVFFFLLFAFF